MHCGTCDHDCNAGTRVSGHCVCAANQVTCETGNNTYCADTNLQTSRLDCGTCGHACQANQMCVNGTYQ